MDPASPSPVAPSTDAASVGSPSSTWGTGPDEFLRVVPLRFGALFIDGILLLPLMLLFQSMVVGLDAEGRPLFASRMAAYAVSSFLIVIYFFLTEAHTGCSVGKRMLDLRIRYLPDIRPPGLRPIFVRTLIFYFLVGHIPNLALQLHEFADASEWVLYWLSPAIIGSAVLGSTMRSSNHFRALHDLVSRTEVHLIPRRDETPPLVNLRPRDLFRQAGSLGGSLPELGRFRILGTLRWESGAKILLGEDPAEGNLVCVRFAMAEEPPLPMARQELWRPTRLKFIQAGQEEASSWAAFVAPHGCAVTDMRLEDKPLLWFEVRRLFFDLAEELALSARDGIVPPVLSLTQVWIQPRGLLLLLDFPLEEGNFPELTADSADARGLELLRHLVAWCLEGRTPDDEPERQPLSIPMPLHMQPILNRLRGVTAPYASLAEIQSDLAAVRDKSAGVGSSLRARQLAILGVLLSCGLLLMFQPHQFEGLLQEFGPFLLIGFWPAIWIAVAILTRGGISYPMSGLRLVRLDGRPAARWQAGVRAAMLWVPLALLLMAATYLEQLNRADLTWLPLSARWLALGLLTGSAWLALRMPTRGIHDQIVGTCLVPE